MHLNIWFAILVILGIVTFVAAFLGLRRGITDLSLRNMGAVAFFLAILLYMVIRQRRNDKPHPDEM